jgi:hypothetical protein
MITKQRDKFKILIIQEDGKAEISEKVTPYLPNFLLRVFTHKHFLFNGNSELTIPEVKN